MTRPRSPVAAALLLLAVARGARADTWTVDDDGPAHFKDLATAVATAKDGDTLLIRPGRYGSVKISKKGLRIVGAGPGVVTIERSESEGDGPFLEARDLSTKQMLLLSGVTGVGRGATIVVERCSGPVVLADLVVDSRHPDHSSAGPFLDRCSNAVLARVAVVPTGQPSPGNAPAVHVGHGSYSLNQVVAMGAEGAAGRSPHGHGELGEVGLAVVDAVADVVQCEFVGGRGGTALWDPAAPFCPEAAIGGTGGAGVHVSGHSKVTIASDGTTEIRGGFGGSASKNPWENCWSFAGDGGAGLFVADSVAPTDVVLSTTTPIAGDSGAGDASRPGRVGAAIDAPLLGPTVADPPIPTIAIDERAVTGGAITLHARGTPGDTIVVLLSSDLGRLVVRGSKGFPMLAVPGDFWHVMSVGRFDVNGTLVVDTELPVDASFVGRVFFVQGYVRPASHSARTPTFTNVDVIAVSDGVGPPVVRSQK